MLIKLIEEWKENLDKNYIVGRVLMDLLKAFDCIPHDLLSAKLFAYGFNGNSLKYIFTYLKKRKQCFHINNFRSDFKSIISRVPQGSIVRPILSNAFLNDFFFCIRKASAHNFADDILLNCYYIKLLLEILIAESKNAINFSDDKFKSIIIQKSNQTIKPNQFLRENDIVEIASSVKLLGILIDDQLNFNLHSVTCKSASKQLNALVRSKCFQDFEERKVF